MPLIQSRRERDAGSWHQIVAPLPAPEAISSWMGRPSREQVFPRLPFPSPAHHQPCDQASFVAIANERSLRVGEPGLAGTDGGDARDDYGEAINEPQQAFARLL